ncbi:MAG: ABC transporter ATP-binding protein [Syntrophomonadaceae bacterium]|jgi:iron complex transport system ATP-binding protein|nr:ABC transporter ATP-binding protein [Syntrophomonadaceae bacterium]MDH7497714.1 ABC transporter ATP-binding protein [Syntrophomonadaceae bacterium]
MIRISVNGVECRFGAREALRGVTLSVGRGEFLGLIGPNGSGKSTLLRTISGVVRPVAGGVLLDGQDVRRMSALDLARALAVVEQGDRATCTFRVWEVVMMGRMPHVGRLQRESLRDVQRVEWALQVTGLSALADRHLDELSGGERQRVVIAKALAQDTDILLLDEPTSHLDIGHQVEILDLLASLRETHRLTVVAAVHDLNLAAQYCDRLVLLDRGRVFACGEPETVVTRENLATVYRTPVMVTRHPSRLRPQVVLLPGRAPAQGSHAPAVHVVGGGGTASALLESLAAHGFRVSLGAVNVTDSDWETARRLGLEVIEAAPFSRVDELAAARALQAMEAARAVIVADMPFGSGNLLNLQAAAEVAERGRTVIAINGSIEGRDFTGGQAEAAFSRLLAGGAVVVSCWEEAVRRLHGLLGRTGAAVEPGGGEGAVLGGTRTGQVGAG